MVTTVRQENGRPGVGRRITALSVIATCAFVLAGCGPAALGAPGEIYRPPPPLVFVVIVDPSAGPVAVELSQVEALVEAEVTPSEIVVVSRLSGASAQATYVVSAGDNLSSIAAAHGVSLAVLEAANPQLGPLGGRDWNRVYPGDLVTIPGAGGATAGNVLVTRAPTGPAPPALVRIPQRPSNATSFQDAQYRRALASAELVNRERVAAWLAKASRDMASWQAWLVARLRATAGDLQAAGLTTTGGRDLPASMEAAANTLKGLDGRRVLLILGGGQGGPPRGAVNTSTLRGIHLVVANITDPLAAAAWRAAGASWGSTVTTLDPAQTELELSQVVNG